MKEVPAGSGTTAQQMWSGSTRFRSLLNVWVGGVTLTLLALPVFAEPAPTYTLHPDPKPLLAKQAFMDASNDLMAMAQIRLGLTRKWRQFQSFIGIDTDEYRPYSKPLPELVDAEYWQDHLHWQPTYYRARAFLPTRDSLKIGVRYQDDIWHDRLGIEFRPYIGQAWTATENIWGAETSLTFRNTERKDIARLAIRFDEGDRHFAIRSPGYDIYGQWQVRDYMTFDVGTRARTDETRYSYGMVRWRWEFK